eukprot:gb/GEZN01028785.1/.p1 GENE.gb/GEZN01028785.1/~~gb/GEZN01028785.1/.p1  ORF type:complete len:103 (-),score=1.39 gb/GEZN01028785.1/:73-381(-)
MQEHRRTHISERAELSQRSRDNFVAKTVQMTSAPKYWKYKAGPRVCYMDRIELCVGVVSSLILIQIQTFSWISARGGRGARGWGFVALSLVRKFMGNVRALG